MIERLLDFGYYVILRAFFKIVFSFYKVEILGRENIPQDSGFILAANHSNFLDGPVIAWALRPRLIYWIVSKDLYRRWYFKPILVMARCVPVNGSVDLAERLLDKKKAIGIFPQGGVCCDRVIKKGHRGVAVLARKSAVPVIPCYIKTVIDPSKKFNIAPKAFSPITVSFGRPLRFEKCPPKEIPPEILNDTLSKIIRAINVLGKNNC